MVPLITSIPPVFSRRAPDGSEIGREYAQACIRSWRTSGFHPITVNAARERRAQIVSEENIPRVEVERDAEDEFGKPLVYLHDLIQAARGATDGPVAITNADIILDVPSSVFKKIEQLRPGECIVQKRIDIDNMNARTGRRFEAGYDFFVYHTADLANFDGGSFVYGLPWWDHYLPIKEYLGGLKPIFVERPFVFHLEHENRWSGGERAALALRFIDSIETLAQSREFASADVRQYFDRIRLAREGAHLSLVDQFKTDIRSWTETGRDRNARKAIGRVAKANVAWLDQQADK